MSAIEQSTTEEFSFSIDGEHYQQSSASRIQAMKEAIDYLGRSNVEIHFWTGRNVPFAPNNPAEDIIVQMQESAQDECGESAEDYLVNVTGEQEKELNVLIFEWLARVDSTSFWSIAEAEEISVGEALRLIEAAEAVNV